MSIPEAYEGGSVYCASKHALHAFMQALRYEALLEAWRDVPWFEGVHWWNWDTDANFGGLANSCLSPQGKPAQTMLRSAYGGTGAVVPPSGAPVCPCIDLPGIGNNPPLYSACRNHE